VAVARLDGRQRSKHAVLAKLALDLGFPDHFRPNLDALFDVLTTDIEGPIRIEWRLTRNAAAGLGPDLEPLQRTIRGRRRRARRPDARHDRRLGCLTPSFIVLTAGDFCP
jgi:hypothetical protein